MKKLFSTKYSAGAFNTAMFFLRVSLGILIMMHGYGKLIDFSGAASHMPSIFGMSTTISAALVIFAEFFCSLFIILGLFTRAASVPLIISCSVALFKAHNGQVFHEGEMITLYLIGFIVILLLGPGKASIDSMIGK